MRYRQEQKNYCTEGSKGTRSFLHLSLLRAPTGGAEHLVELDALDAESRSGIAPGELVTVETVQEGEQ